ncbi:helix-turn-helix transcriptional regulator [Streptomyces sp. NPDC002143]
MPERQFDPTRVRIARRTADLTQDEMAHGVGVSASAVANWEAQRAAPSAEKLPWLAKVLQRDLDELFPREGLRDLRDLRCDAGLTREDTKAITGTLSSKAVRNAEEGRRRLPEALEGRLAEAYGIPLEVLRAAQERSFGHPVPEPRQAAVPVAAPVDPPPAGQPEAIAAQIGLLLSWIPMSAQPSDAEIAARGNERLGRNVLDEFTVARLRTGAQADASDEVREALALALEAPRLFLSGDEQDQRLARGAILVKQGILCIAARGSSGDISGELLAWIAEAVEKSPGNPEKTTE